MIYLWPSSAIEGITHGLMLQPGVRHHRAGLKQGLPWAYDNGCYSGFDPVRWLHTLDAHETYRETCLFVTCPDVVGNALATLEKWRTWMPVIVERGWPVAFVAQDGQEFHPFPPEFDTLFVGGTTEWKLSPRADDCIRRAQALGKWVHVGRVNTQRRIRHFQRIGVDSVDGTAIAFEPDAKIRLIGNAMAQPPLFRLCDAIPRRDSPSKPGSGLVRYRC